MGVQQRIQILIDHLGITPRQFETMTGLSNGTCAKLNDAIRQTTCRRIARAFPDLNMDWLLTGKGELQLSKTGRMAESARTKVIRYYPEVEGTAGGVQFLDNPDERSVEMLVPFCSDCTCAINLHGNSMAPVIKSGQIILLSEWTDRFIEWGKIYLVVTRSGYRCVKYLYPSKNENAITCHSEDSEHYPDFDIDHDDIVRLFIVKGWFCRDML